jgi:cytochrome c553
MQTHESLLFGRFRRCAILLTMWLVEVVAPCSNAAARDQTGEQIYRRKCASCHGATGEGTDDQYPRALAGDRSPSALARLIARTMPEDAPGECVGEDAEKVAAYIYESFYSKAAQARNQLQLPRIELCRLTVRQYRNVVTDLIGSFRPPSRWDERRGLQGDYSSRTRRRRNGNGSNASLRRIDPEIQFDFGTDSPLPEQRALKEFSKRWQQMPVLWVPLAAFRPFSQEFRINWQGSVLAPETGEYEFLIKTENASRLWVEDTARPLIDAAVKSGSDTEYRASIYLLGGRIYPMRLEFTRSKEPTASIALEWKLPRRSFEVIPRWDLSPSVVPESFVLKTPFPPDDRSVGYERGTSISKVWEQATTDAAIEVAGYVVAHLKELADLTDNGPDREAKARNFCLQFAERAFRQPLLDEQKAFFVDHQFKAGRDVEATVKRVVLLVLKSPRFLYRELKNGRPDHYDVASRISFGLWDSLPDPVLLAAAAAGQLSTHEQVARQAERMVTDVRAHSKLREFLLQWLRVEQPPEIIKDRKQFSQFDEAIASDLRTSLELFLQDVMESKTADFRELLTAEGLYLNSRLARFYGAKLAPNAQFQKVDLEPHTRAGVLSHPYLMANFAYTATSSPIHRGVFLSRSLLGRVLRPPPEAVAPLAVDLHPDLTTRQRVTLQTKPESCQSCHGMINSLGFTLEHFDAVGRYRNQEKQKPIDATGTYETRKGELVRVNGVRELAAFLARSDETHTAFVQQLFHYMVKQPIRAFGPQVLPELRRFFVAQDFNVRKLMTEVVAKSALTPRREKS